MDSEKGAESEANLNPLSSLDLVDALLDGDDVGAYLRPFPGSGGSGDFLLQDVNRNPNPTQAPEPQLPLWHGLVEHYPPANSQPLPHHLQLAQPQATAQGLAYGFGASGAAPAVGGKFPSGDAQVVTTGGDPGFVFQAEGPTTLARSSGDSGSSSGQRGHKWGSPRAGHGAAQKKQQVTQEKNRLAQRRFRERQKAKVQGLHSEIDELKAQVGALQLQNSELHSQNSILEKVLSMRDEQIMAMQEDSSILDMASSTGDGKKTGEGVTLSGLKGDAVTLTWKELKKMTTHEVMQIYQAYVKEISEALVEVASNRPGGMDRIELLTNELCLLCVRFSAANPLSARALHANPSQDTEAEELKTWKKIVATLDLSNQQKLDIIQLRKMLLQKLQKLLAERGKLNLTIQSGLPSSTVAHRINLEYLKVSHTLGRLKDILGEEHKAMQDFVTTFAERVMKPLQVAKIVVQCYPVKPDLLAIASTIALEEGEDLNVPSDTYNVSSSSESRWQGQGSRCCSSVVSDQSVLRRLGLDLEH